ncbi:MAG: rhodanese-like domain-containing protein [Chromatiaceae bacterium]|nr:MAG: rhodanese-like domain-containing protein [Chromatiaceae bacterium]
MARGTASGRLTRRRPSRYRRSVTSLSCAGHRHRCPAAPCPAHVGTTGNHDAGPRVLTAVALLRALAEAHSDAVADLIQSYLRARDGLEPVPADELLERARAGLVTVLDCRPPQEYAQGHIPGAVNIPLEQLEARLDQLPRDRRVVAYCRGPWCMLSFEAVARLRAAGFDARRLADGMPEWRHAGRPVE